MSRIDSPSKRYPGYVILPDDLTFPQVLAWEDATLEAGKTPGSFHKVHAYIPGVLVCVQEWHIDGFPEPLTADNFPWKPPAAVIGLMSKIIAGVTDLIYEADEEKNA